MPPTHDLAPMPGPANVTPVAPGPSPEWSRPVTAEETSLLPCPPGTALVRKDTRLDVVSMWFVCERPGGIAHGPGVFFNETRLVRVTFDEGVLEGDAAFHHATGSVATLGHYHRGKPTGEWSSPDRIGGRDGRDVTIVHTYADGIETKDVDYRPRDAKVPGVRLDGAHERMIAIFRDDLRKRSSGAKGTTSSPSSTFLVASADVASARLKALGWTVFAVVAVGLVAWKILRSRRA